MSKTMNWLMQQPNWLEHQWKQEYEKYNRNKKDV